MHHAHFCAVAELPLPPPHLSRLLALSCRSEYFRSELDMCFVSIKQSIHTYDVRKDGMKICLKSNGISTRRSNNRSITIIQPFYKFLQLIFRHIIIFTFHFGSNRERVCMFYFYYWNFCTRSAVLRLCIEEIVFLIVSKFINLVKRSNRLKSICQSIRNLMGVHLQLATERVYVVNKIDVFSELISHDARGFPLVNESIPCFTSECSICDGMNYKQ